MQKLKPWLIILGMLLLWFVGLSALIKQSNEGGSLLDEWKLTSPGRMELVGTDYYFVTADGEKFTTYGPHGYSDRCYVISVCKRRINEQIDSRKAMGL